MMKISTNAITSLLAIVLLLGNLSAQAFDFAPLPPPMYQGLILLLFPNGHAVPFSGQSGSSRAKERSNSTLANGNDVASSVAAFIAGNYMVLNNVVVPDPHFQRMLTQLRNMLGQNAGYNKLAIADKRCLHEQPAMLSIYMAVAQSHYKKRPTLLLKKLS